EEAARDAKRATDDFTEAINNLLAAGDPRGLQAKTTQSLVQEFFAPIDELSKIYDELQELDRKRQEIVQRRIGVTTTEELDAVQAELDIVNEQIRQRQEQINTTLELTRVYGGATQAQRELNETMSAL